MDSSKFHALLKAIEYGSLTKAAEDLGYTQAGLTHMMNRLEKEIGITLLQRTKTGVSLTSHGEKLLPLIRAFAEQGLELEKAIKNLTESNDAVIRIASYASITNHWLPMIISNFQKDYPNVRFELHVGNLDEICRLVSNSEIDLGFTSKQEILHGDWINLKNDPLYAVLPPDCKIEGETVPISIFNNKAFFMPTYGFDYDIMNTLKQKLILQENNMNDGVLTGKSMEQILKEKNIMLKRQIDKIDTELSAYKELAITAVLTAGFNFDSKPYKELVRKEYLTNNLR